MALKEEQNGSSDVERGTSAIIVSRLKGVFSINTRMLMTKVAYLLYGALMAFHLPFIVIFMQDVGLTVTQAGFIAGIRYTTSAVAAPLWGMLADYTGRRRLILVVLCLGAAFPIGAMPWIARRIHPTVCLSNITINNTCASDILDQIKEERQMLFWVYLVIILFGSIFVISIPGYIDSIAINVVKCVGKQKASYGAQRVFGSIGFSIAGFLGGLACDHYDYKGLSQYTAVFFMYVPSILFLIPVASYMISQAVWDEDKANTSVIDEKEKEIVKTTWENSLTRRVLLLLKEFDVAFFMTTIFINGLANGIYMSFSFSLIKDTLNPSTTIMTFIVVTGSTSELLVFPFTSKLIKWLRGTPTCITLGIFAYFVRFLTVSYATKVWQMIMIQALHCIAFALSWAAIIEHTHEITPKDLKMTMFNIINGIFFSVSAIVANMLGGYIYDNKGGRILFRAIATVCGVWSLLMAIYYVGKAYKTETVSPENSIQLENNCDIGVVNPIGVHEDDAT